MQFGTTLGIAIGFFICYGTVNISSSLSWRLPFILQSACALALAMSCPFLPPSPRWLIARGRQTEVNAAFERLGLSREAFEEEIGQGGRGTATPVEHDGDGRPILNQQRKRTGFLRVLRKDARKQALLGMFLMSMAQFSGIDGVLYVSSLPSHHLSIVRVSSPEA